MGLLEELPKYDTDAGELAVEDEGPSQPKRRRRLTLWITCGVVAVTAAVALFIVDRQVEGGVFGQKSVENSLENTSYICFSSRRELDIAVDLYLDQESEALLKQTYGPRIGSWCVDRITDFSQLFSVQRHPSAATFQQDLSRWNLSLATNLSHMFYGAQDFQGNGLELWNVLNVADMTGTFFKATRFNANLSAWDTRSVTSLRDTFREALSFAGDGLDQWNVSAVTSLAGTFREAPAMQASLSDWDVQRVTDMNNLFREAKSFQGPLSNWKVDRVTDMAGLFRDAVLFDSELPWNTSSVTDMQWMFSGAESFRGDLSWDVSRVTDMEYLFFRAFKFRDENLSLSRWNVSSVKNMAGIFRDTPFQGDVSMWDVSNVWKMLEAFMDTPYFNGDLSSWKVQRVTTMRLMFAGASAFDGDLPWDVSGVFDTYGMFRGAKSFTGKGLNLWNPYQANSMAFMFHNASSFRQDLCAWQLSASPNVTQMFQGTACPHQTDPVETYSICVSCSN